MSRLAPEFPIRSGHYAGEERPAQSAFVRGIEYMPRAPSLLVPGLVLLGLGALAWYYLGPDLRRYMKIQSM
jgi:hypothetical protein